jgi:ribosomal protein L16 Arg81 hydroxylase
MSQVDWLDSQNIAKFTDLQKVTPPYEILLKPGDILYIPPYWGHHVSAVDFSISVSTHIRSTEVLIREEMNDSLFPFQEGTDISIKKIALLEYFKKLFFSDNEMKKFIQFILKSRYEPLVWDKYVDGLMDSLDQVFYLFKLFST